jgi:hypothetical protein
MELYTYLIRIYINPDKVLLITSFSIPNAEDALKEFYHRKFSNVQRNIHNYKVISMGKFNAESDFFKIACDGIEYAELYS